MPSKLTNIVVAGIGGQGVLKASDILADVATRSGLDVKKSEIKGMSQRGGSVSSDVRFGERVFSPMVSPGEADYLLVLEPTQIEPNRHMLKTEGVLITPDAIDATQLANRKSLNVALLGALSAHLSLPAEDWLAVLRDAFPPDFFAHNEQAFFCGRNAAAPPPAGCACCG